MKKIKLIDSLRKNIIKPTQCHLWKKDALETSDLNICNFELVHTFSEDSHFSRRLVMCKDCKQLYLKEFYEEIDWVGGEDPQYTTYIPVRDKKEAKIINRSDIFDIQSFYPKINLDWPKGKEMTVKWIGRQ